MYILFLLKTNILIDLSAKNEWVSTLGGKLAL